MQVQKREVLEAFFFVFWVGHRFHQYKPTLKNICKVSFSKIPSTKNKNIIKKVKKIYLQIKLKRLKNMPSTTPCHVSHSVE